MGDGWGVLVPEPVALGDRELQRLLPALREHPLVRGASVICAPIGLRLDLDLLHPSSECLAIDGSDLLHVYHLACRNPRGGDSVLDLCAVARIVRDACGLRYAAVQILPRPADPGDNPPTVPLRVAWGCVLDPGEVLNTGWYLVSDAPALPACCPHEP